MRQGLLSVFTILYLSATGLKAQTPFNYVFSSDSLKGFDEQKALSEAKSKHLIDQEFAFYLFREKREFINHKYHLVHHDGIVWNVVQKAAVQLPCTNVDFEDGSFTGWTVSNGSNNNSITMAGCCSPGTGVASVIPAVGTDGLVSSISLVSPLGGNQIAKLNDETAGNKSQRISQTFNVTSSNAIFQIAYCGVLNSGGHGCPDQPYINISVMDSVGTVLSCPKINIQAPDPACVAPASVTAGWTYAGFDNQFGAVYYHTWEVKTIDLSPYIGSNITVQITVGDCTFSAHYGYAYFDCRCLPLEIDLNGTVFDATPQTPINVSTCGSVSAAVTAPIGQAPYLWDGPPGSGVSGVTTQSMSTSTPGTYTLTMSPAGGCFGSTVKYIILHVTPNPTVTNVTAQATCTNATGSGTVNVASGTAPFTYGWQPPASTASVATGLAPGTDYTVTAIDTFGCRGTTIISIASFTDAPTYTISPLSGNLTCTAPSLTVTTITGVNTTAVWTHTATQNFDVTAPGSYSCVLTNTLTSCTATVPVSITSTTVAPVATYSLLCNATTATLSAQSTPGVALGWLAPTTPPSPISNPGISNASGVFTLTATNLTTGCKETYTVESIVPTISVVTNPTTTNLTCITSAIQATTSTSTAGTNITWASSAGTFTTNPYTFTSPGTYTTTVALPGACSTQSVFTIASNTVVNVTVTSPSTVIPCSTDSLQLTANGFGGGPYTYTWTAVPTSTGNVYYASTAGTYSVVVKDAVTGCTTTATYSVSHETIDASFVGDPTSGLMPLPVTFTNTSSTVADYYTWNYVNGSPIDTILHGSTTFNWQGDYPVILTAIKGYCRDTAVRIIHVELVSFLTIPNVFTPNGDKVNDEFVLSAINLGEITMTVFDRWGKKVFDSTANGVMKWDGKTKSGAEAADGTYFYIIKAAGLDDKSYDYQGTVNIFR